MWSRLQLSLAFIFALFVSLQLAFRIFGGPPPVGATLAWKPPLVAETDQEVDFKTLAQENYARLSGGWEWAGAGSTEPMALSRFNDATLETAFEGSRLALYAYLNGQSLEIKLDGATPFRLVAPQLHDYEYLELLHNLPPGQHDLRLRLVGRAGDVFLARSLRTDGHFETEKYATQPRLLGFGSSTIEFCGVTWQLGQAAGWNAINRGIGGSTVTSDGQYRVARDVLPFEPDTVLINYGSNDWFANIAPEQFQAAYVNMLRQLGSGLPNAHFIVMGLFPRKGGNEITRRQFNQAIKAAITKAKLNDRTNYVEIAGYNWATDSLDGTHPNPTAVANEFVPQLLPLLKDER